MAKGTIALIVIIVVILLIVGGIVLSVAFSSTKKQNYEELARNEANIETLIRDLPTTDRIEYPVIYINLDRSPTRREFMEQQLKSFGIKYSRMRGIDGKTIDFEKDTIKDYFDRPLEFVNTYKTITKSELGCTLSHLCSIKAARELGYDAVVIFEDDVSLNLVPLWTKNLRERVKECPSDWEIIQLFSYDRELDVKTTFHRCDGKYYWSCAAYLINRRGMDRVLGACLGSDGKIHLGDQEYDGLADVFVYASSQNTYVCSVPLFYPANDHNAMNSTIHTGHTNYHMTRSREMIDYYLGMPYFSEKGNDFHDLFIEKLLEPRILSKSHFPSKSGIVVVSAPSPDTQEVLDKYSENWVMIVDGEPHDISNLRGANVVITTKKDLVMKDNTPCVYAPLYAFNIYGFSKPYYSIEDLLSRERPSLEEFSKRKFCVFMYSNCDETREGVKYRKEFLDRLQERSGGRVEVLGKCYNPNYRKNGTHLNANEIFKNYKFVVAIENSFKNGYITEKLVNPMVAGAIPIYMGAPNVGEDFDVKSFVHIRDFGSIDECIDRILLLDAKEGEQELKSIFSRSWFLNNEIPRHSRLEEIREKVRPHLTF